MSQPPDNFNIITNETAKLHVPLDRTDLKTKRHTHEVPLPEIFNLNLTLTTILYTILNKNKTV